MQAPSLYLRNISAAGPLYCLNLVLIVHEDTWNCAGENHLRMARQSQAAGPGLPGPAPQAAAARTGGTASTPVPRADIPQPAQAPLPDRRSTVTSLSAGAAASAAALALAAHESLSAEVPSEELEDASPSDVMSSKAVNLSRREAEVLKRNGLCQPFTEYQPSKVILESTLSLHLML